MLKEEIGELIDRKKFSKTIRCYGGDDKLRDLMQEIYYDGMREGYELAKFRLKLHHGMPFGAADEYLDKNMKKIREILDLCKQYEDCDR